MSTNLTELLSKQSSEIKKPLPLPAGTWLFMNQKAPEFPENGIGKNNTPAAVFALTVLQPIEVDQDQLSNYSSEFGDPRGKTMRFTVFLTDASLYYARQQVVDAFAIEDADDLTLGQIFAQTANRQVIGEVKQEPNRDGTDLVSFVTKLAKA